MYTLTGTSSQGCTASDEVTVVVNPVPVVIAGADQTVCSGEQVVLIASGADNYVWSNGVSNNIPFLPLPGVNTYSVVGTNSFGCTAMDEVQVSVVILEQPNFQVIGSGCAPLEITLDSYSTSGNCDWQISNGESLSGCTVQTILSQPGCYDVTLTITQSGCTSSITALNAICADEVPSAFFVSDPLQGTTLDPTVQFVNLSQNATSYEWFFGDGSDTSNAFEPIHDFPSDESGSYEVMLVASSLNGCTDTAITIIVINEELVYYVPNAFTPDADSYNQVFLPVFTSGFDPLEYHLTIFNRWGEIVFESYDSEVGWAGDYGTIDPNFQCQDGVYTWKIEFKLLSDDSRKEIFGHVNLLR
jgi:PKD repeat protein